jgi:hypothetical protein
MAARSVVSHRHAAQSIGSPCGAAVRKRDEVPGFGSDERSRDSRCPRIAQGGAGRSPRAAVASVAFEDSPELLRMSPIDRTLIEHPETSEPGHTSPDVPVTCTLASISIHRGLALAGLQAGGRRFESARLHSPDQHRLSGGPVAPGTRVMPGRVISSLPTTARSSRFEGGVEHLSGQIRQQTTRAHQVHRTAVSMGQQLSLGQQLSGQLSVDDPLSSDPGQTQSPLPSQPRQ